MANRTFSLTLAALLTWIPAGAGLLAQDDPEPKPLPAGPDAYTQKRYQADKARFWQDVLLAECRAGNALRKEWKPHVEELTALYAEYFCASILTGDRAKRMVGLCDRLRDLHCDDPVVQLVTADVRFFQRKVDEARDLYAAAAKGIADRKSGLLLQLRLQSCLHAFHAFDKHLEQAGEAAVRRDACLVELAGSPEFGPGSERFYLDLVLQSLRGNVGKDDLLLLEQMEKRAGKPSYALLVLRAMYHNAMAWASRGQGPASSVSDTDRKGFAEHLRAAAELTLQANQLCPRHPEAPTMMVKTLGPGGADPKELRRWFDLAVAAQFDWSDAYTSYMHYLQPRWGGSQKALTNFGAECLATARFDTMVPSFYRVAVHYITLDSRDPTAVWAQKSVQKRLEELDKGNLAAAADERATMVANTHRITGLALGGKAPEAAALYEQVGHRIDAKALEIYGVSEDWLKKTLRPHFKDYKPAEIAPSDAFEGFETAPSLGIDKARAWTSHEHAITADQFNAAYAKWLGESFVQAYERAGKHDDTWDADARALLAGMGEVVIGGKPAGGRERAEKLLEAGCKDPLTLYAVTRHLKGGDPAASAKTLLSALPNLVRDQPPVFAWWGKQYLSELAEAMGRPGVGSGLLPEMREHLLAAAADPMFAGNNRRFYIRALWGEHELARPGTDWMTDKMVATLGTMQGVDPWIVHVVTGLHNARKAKHPSGSEQERHGHLRLVTEHLGAAHKLCPEFPEAAVGMIVVASIEQGGTTAREWFDRALDAEIDYHPAYCAYVDSLRPLYFGSIKAMYRFAVDCLDSGRFDTDVPLWYPWTMQRIQEEVQTPRQLWASAGVAERLDKMFNGYKAQGRKAHDEQYLNAGRCMLAWAGGRYDDALASWDAAGKKVDARWLPTVGSDDPDLIEFDLKFLESRRSK